MTGRKTMVKWKNYPLNLHRKQT
jgi:hypothetical protein